MIPGVVGQLSAVQGSVGPTAALDSVAGIVSAAWSVSRDLLSSWTGNSRYTELSGAVQQVNDQTGNGLYLNDQGSATARPALTTAGPNSVACMDFDGSSDRLMADFPLTSFISFSSGYMIVSLIADTIANNSANSYENNGALGDDGGLIGIYLRNTTGTPETAIAFNWDGNDDHADSAAITTGSPYVIEWRHEGGSIHVRVNGGADVSAASGNTLSLAGLMTMGMGYTGASTRFDGKVFEAAVFSSPPTLSERDAIVADFMAHIGA